MEIVSPVGAAPLRQRRERRGIPAKVKRALLCECGYKCSVLTCLRKDHIEFHHIDEDRCNNDQHNILVLCREHHKLARTPRPGMDRRHWLQLKALIELHAEGFSREALQARLMDLQGRLQAGTEATERFVTFVSDLLSRVPGLVPLSESGLSYRNQFRARFLTGLEPLVLVKCVAPHAGQLDKAPVVELLSDVLLRGWSVGLLFSLLPLGHDAELVAWNVSARGLAIILLGPDDIAKLIRAEERPECLKAIAKRFRSKHKVS